VSGPQRGDLVALKPDLRARYYDPQSERFTQEDPIGVAGGVNLYAYVGNNPSTLTDPFGLCPPESPWTPACDKPLESAGLFDPTMWLAGGIAGGARRLEGMLLGRAVAGAAAEATATFSARALAGDVAEATGGAVSELANSEGYKVTLEVGRRAVVARIKQNGEFRVSISGLASLTRAGALSSERALTHLTDATAQAVTRLVNAAVDLLKARAGTP
jgi:RHS repeat-associated protein